MQIRNGTIYFENNELDIWEKLLERELTNATIPVEVLRDLGDRRVEELHDTGQLRWATMAAEHVADIPKIVH